MPSWDAHNLASRSLRRHDLHQLARHDDQVLTNDCDAPNATHSKPSEGRIMPATVTTLRAVVRRNYAQHFAVGSKRDDPSPVGHKDVRFQHSDCSGIDQHIATKRVGVIERVDVELCDLVNLAAR